MEVSWDEVRARRLARSFLSERAGGDRLLEVVSALCGVQAQLQTAAELQLGARVDGVTQAELRALVWEQRVLVRAWTLRGTLHLHPAAELPLWHAAKRAAQGSAREGLPAWRDPARILHPGLGADEVEAVRAEVWSALDGRCLTRAELAEEVGSRVGAAAQARVRSGFAFFNSDLCQGPPQGSRITLVRPDQWVEGWQEVDGREALREVCRRFLRTYGPARPADFASWFGAAEPQALFDELGADLEEIDVAGRLYFVLAGDRSFPVTDSQVRLLSEYDVYVLGFRERDELVPEPVRKLIANHRRGQYEGPAATRIVLVDGIAAGLWERRKRGRRIELQIRLVRQLGKAGFAELQREAERIGAFLGLEPVVAVDVG
ncbi:MAG TPA: winged helix DNA-binding domain-containing protein [Gaiellaceae bacterium]|nr:winged helix DNA-binding domain-containing protein [Gaiellaceae bacterium]